MNRIKIQALLEQWTELINVGEQASKEKADKNGDGLDGRIKRTTGKPVIFDFDTYKNQQKIQNLLCHELPEWTNIIRGQPDIMDNYAWRRGDFIELYYRHFRLIVEKLHRIINNSSKKI